MDRIYTDQQFDRTCAPSDSGSDGSYPLLWYREGNGAELAVDFKLNAP